MGGGWVFDNVKCHPSFIKVTKKSYTNNAVKVWCSNVLKSLSYLINQNSPLRGGEGGGLFGRFKCCPKFINIVEKCFTNDAVKVRSWDTLKSLSYLINCNSPPMGGSKLFWVVENLYMKDAVKVSVWYLHKYKSY